MNPESLPSIRLRYTFRFIIGFVVASAIIYLGYWLIFEYKVTNIFAIAAIIIFIGLPAISVVFNIPLELAILRKVWTDDDPKAVISYIDEMRKRGLV